MKAVKENKARMKMIGKIVTGIAVVILSGALCAPQAVLASGEDLSAGTVSYTEADTKEGNWPIDLEKSDCTIDLSMSYKKDGKVISLDSGSLSLYTVAGVKEENGYVYDVTAGKFASVEGVSGIPAMSAAELDENNEKLAKAMAAAVTSGNIAADDVQKISSGKVTFTGLKAGLYLIIQTEVSDGNRKIDPFLISIPDENGSYSVSAAPKNGILVPVTSTPTPTPKNTITPRPKVTTTVRKTSVKKTTVLPKTGQMWWPVAVFAVIGMVLIVMGRRISH